MSPAPPRPPRGKRRGARPLALLFCPSCEGPRCPPPSAHARGAVPLSVAAPEPKAAVSTAELAGSREGAAGGGSGGACGTVRRGASPARAAAAHVRRVPTPPAAPGPLSAGRAKRGRPGGRGARGRDPLRSSGAPPLGPSFTWPSDGRFVQKTVRSGREQVRSVVDEIAEVILALSLAVLREQNSNQLATIRAG